MPLLNEPTRPSCTQNKGPDEAYQYCLSRLTQQATDKTIVLEEVNNQQITFY